MPTSFYASSADGNKKVGLDDYIVANGPGAFQKLLENADEPELPEAGEELAYSKDADPLIEAKAILNGCRLDGANRLLYWRDSYWWWNKGSFAERPDGELRAHVVAEMGQRLRIDANRW